MSNLSDAKLTELAKKETQRIVDKIDKARKAVTDVLHELNSLQTVLIELNKRRKE